MPNTPLRERILERIAERLSFVVEGSTYFHTIHEVHRILKAPPSVLDAPLTATVFSPGEQIISARSGLGDPTGIVEVVMLVTVRIWRGEEVISDTTSNEIIHDVKRCLCANRNLPDADGNNLTTNLRWSATTAVADESTAPYAALDVTFEVQFRESFADPSQLR